MIRLHYYTFNRLIVKDKQNHIAAKKNHLFSVKPRYTLYKAVLRSSDESNLILNGTNNMSNKPNLLNDDDMQRFISDGYLTIQADFPGAFHRKIYDQATALYDTEGNPGNDLLPRIPSLYDVLGHPDVDGALQSLLGSDYLIHPHRHGHHNPAGSAGQNQHKDSYEADENVRHHHCRWVMGFYYPQDVDASRGPSAVLPGTQYFSNQDLAYKQTELPLYGPAGSFTIVHYDLWHRAMPNAGPLPRFMLKFLFCRMAEPSIPAWQCEGDAWQSLDCSPSDLICRHQWDWFNDRPSGSAPCDQPVDALRQQYRHGDEADRLKAAYSMGTHGEEGVLVLMDELRQEAEDKTALNLQKDHTNPCQFDAAYGLVAAGTDAMPTLIEALDDSEWAVRASAADILGDMGTLAAHTTPQLIKALNDSSLWVRRNAAEALGIFGVEAKDAVPALSRTLSDQNARVRLNAVSALQRIGPAAETAVDRLRQTLQDETYFIRAHAQIALDRIHVIS